MKVKGKSTPKVHSGKTVTKNAVAATCTQFGYSGDVYCECGVLLKAGEIVAPGHNNLKLINSSACSTYGKLDAEYHRHTCVVAGCGMAYGQIASHKFNSAWNYSDSRGHAHMCTENGCIIKTASNHTHSATDEMYSDNNGH